MRRLRIYIVIATFHPLVGGAERQALLQGRSLRERGHEATIMTFSYNKAWPTHDVLDGVPVMRVAGRLLGERERLPRVLQRLCYLLAVLLMGWTLWHKRHDYDLLHVYQLNVLSLPTALVCWLGGKPLIVAVRSAHLEKFEGEGKGADNWKGAGKRRPYYNSWRRHDRTRDAGADQGEQRLDCKGAGKRRPYYTLLAGPLDPGEPWLKVDGSLHTFHDLADLERFGKPLLKFSRFLLLQSRAVVIVLSTRMKDYLAAYNFNMPQVELIPNGVDITQFFPCERTGGDGEEKQTVVCVSNMRYVKGNDVLLQAWRLVHEQYPQARLLLVGDGPLRAQLEQMAQALTISESVEFAGLQSDILAQLHKGMIAVLPSRNEGMPNAILEAMACGMPCVATRVSGSEDIIQTGVNGLLVEIEDYESMAEALLSLLRQPQLVREMGLAARRTIEQHYAIEQVIDTCTRLYQRTVENWAQKGIHQCAE